MSTEPTAPKEEAKPKKKLWDTVLTATPILLTVLGTILASRSSGEMTQAQYYRSVAAQNQSRAGDQWAFFQAKKVRGTIQQMFAERGAFRPAAMLAVANRLPKALERTEAEAKALLDALNAVQPGTDSNSAELQSLKKAVEKYQADVRLAVKEAHTAQAAVSKTLAPLEKTAAAPEPFAFLTSTKLPVPPRTNAGRPSEVVDAVVDRDVLEALIDTRLIAIAKGIRDDGTDDVSAKTAKLEKEAQKLGETLHRVRPNDDVKVHVPTADSVSGVVTKLEADRVARLKKLDERKIQHSIDLAEEKASQFDKATDPATGAIRSLDALLAQEEAAFRPVQADAEDIQMAVADLPTDSKLADVRKAADNLQTSVGRIGTEIGSVSSRFKAARCDFEVRRYDREARFNQEVAALYELQVRKSGLSSDVHRERSMFFLYGMLAAQAGVTIATFALAVRQKSVLWALATAAGVTAITIAIFAYQFV